MHCCWRTSEHVSHVVWVHSISPSTWYSKSCFEGWSMWSQIVVLWHLRYFHSAVFMYFLCFYNKFILHLNFLIGAYCNGVMHLMQSFWLSGLSQYSHWKLFYCNYLAKALYSYIPEMSANLHTLLLKIVLCLKFSI